MFVDRFSLRPVRDGAPAFSVRRTLYFSDFPRTIDVDASRSLLKVLLAVDPDMSHSRRDVDV